MYYPNLRHVIVSSDLYKDTPGKRSWKDRCFSSSRFYIAGLFTSRKFLVRNPVARYRVQEDRSSIWEALVHAYAHRSAQAAQSASLITGS